MSTTITKSHLLNVLVLFTLKIEIFSLFNTVSLKSSVARRGDTCPQGKFEDISEGWTLDSGVGLAGMKCLVSS